MNQNQIFELPNLSDYDYENIFSVYTDEDGFFFYNLLNSVNFPEDISPLLYNLYTVKAGEVWPTISYRVYNTIKLWWLICAANRIFNPLVMPDPGTKIKVLTAPAVNQVLKRINQVQ